MEDVDPDPGVKKRRILCSTGKFFYFLLIHVQLPNFILLFTGTGISFYWYQYQYIFHRYPNLFQLFENN